MGYLILDEYLPIGDSLIYYDVLDQPSITETVSLIPSQQYRLIVDVSASGLLDFNGGSPDGRAGIAFTLTQVVPEPSAVVLAVAMAMGLTQYRAGRGPLRDSLSLRISRR